ncbi:MAG TPA: HD domain-containing protein [Chloroflexota bacterium]|nr:HD domain-containing protein [Chloroflexota bacterium]
MQQTQSLSERADALEEQMMRRLDRLPSKSVLYVSGDHDPTQPLPRPPEGALVLMGEDPRLPKMPEKPTLIDFFTHRLASGGITHLLQSANLARKGGHPEKVVLACLLHDIAVSGFIRADHGYWGAQLVEPYVDEEVSWAIRAHQALRFYPDEAYGYPYPETYRKWFGEDYKPEPYIEQEYQRARNHKWYEAGRLICVNDLYAFDPDVVVKLEDFVDIIGRNFKQPEEGLGFDSSPVAHMWRTMIMPTRFL